jgi:four helix bundle protein
MGCVANIKSFRDLIAWQRAMTLAELVYDVTEHFPTRERFGLAQQMRKSAVSIPSNIAEGSRHGTTAYMHYLVVALGSHAELDTQGELATRRHLITDEAWSALTASLAEVGRLTHGLLRSLKPPNP